MRYSEIEIFVFQRLLARSKMLNLENCLKHKIFPAAYLSRVHTVRKNQERKYAFKGSQEKS